MVKNIISIDLEEWFSGKDIFDRFAPSSSESQLELSTSPILKLLEKYNTRATFFVLGKSAENNPRLIQKIWDAGHEIASHGYEHVSISKLGPKEFEADIDKSTNIIKGIVGKKPIGYRAPMFSLNNKTKWSLPILQKKGFKYDSSIFPFKSKYYGVNGAPTSPYHIDFSDVRKEDKKSKIMEYPIKIKKIAGIPFVISGGFYLRLYPVSFIKHEIRKLNKNNEKAIVYFHPWEAYAKTPRVNMTLFSNFVTYYNIKRGLEKVESLLKSFRFHSFEDDLTDENCYFKCERKSRGK